MRKFSFFPVAALALLAASTMFGASVCPVMTGGNAGGGGGVSGTYIADSGVTNGGCNVLITFNADGSITTTFPNKAISYDNGGDDNLVGIVNNSGHSLGNVTLTGTNTPFDFDGDGACDPTWIFAGSNPCGTVTAANAYGHQGVTFSGISANTDTGTVNFAGGIASGASNWFSLEGPVDLNLKINATPEPSSIVLFGSILTMAAWKIRRRRRTQ